MIGNPDHYQFTVDESEAGTRVDVYLARHLTDSSRAQVQRAAAAGALRVNGAPAKVGYKIREGDAVDLQLVRPEDPGVPKAEAISLDIVYEDDAIVVVNKPAGMVVHPAVGHWSGTLVNALLGRGAVDGSFGPTQRPGIVHRLDKDTSGLLIVARTELAHRRLAEQLKNRTLKRSYWAVSWGHFRSEITVFEGAIGRSVTDRKRMAVSASGRSAKSTARVLERFDLADLIEVTLDSGRTHQIRVHLSHAGHPVVADTLYAGGEPHVKGVDAHLRLLGRRMIETIGRTALHARTLALIHPLTEEALSFSADPPRDFLGLVDLCRDPGRADQARLVRSAR